MKSVIPVLSFFSFVIFSPADLSFETHSGKNQPELNISWPLDGSVLLNRAFPLRSVLLHGLFSPKAEYVTAGHRIRVDGLTDSENYMLILYLNGYEVRSLPER
jgi:hypothetical protein